MKINDFKDYLKKTNNDLFKHKKLHNHYIIHIDQQSDELLYATACNELEDLGFAKAQCQYAYYMDILFNELEKDGMSDKHLMILRNFWKEFNNKEHLDECSICKEHRALLKEIEEQK